MEWRRCLADLLAVAARELLAHRLDHLPLTRHRFQRPGHVFAELAQAIAAAAFARRRRIDHNALAGKMIGEGIAFGARARKSANSRRPGDGFFGRKLVFGGAGFQLFKRKRQLVDQPRRAFRSLPVDLALAAWRSAASAGQSAQLSSDAFARATASSAAISRAFARSLANATFRAVMSSGRASRGVSMQTRES